MKIDLNEFEKTRLMELVAYEYLEKLATEEIVTYFEMCYDQIIYERGVRDCFEDEDL